MGGEKGNRFMEKALRFTGVIEDMGEVAFKGNAPERRSVIMLKIKPRQILNRLNPGEDIAVNGVCLTIREIDNDGFVLWYVPQMKNDDRVGHEYCWAESVLENGVYTAKTFPCFAWRNALNHFVFPYQATENISHSIVYP